MCILDNCSKTSTSAEGLARFQEFVEVALGWSESRRGGLGFIGKLIEHYKHWFLKGPNMCILEDPKKRVLLQSQISWKS